MDKIIPAIPEAVREQPPISSEELQKMLHVWFENKGLLTDLRCHLRSKMVEILKDTTMGNTVQTSKPANLTEQAVNLIVAEYLVRNNCHYSLSMFTTEVSLTKQFDTSTMHQNWQFTKENLLSILELNGIPKYSVQCEQILQLYYGCNGNLSLLTTLIRVLSEVLKTQLHKLPETPPAPPLNGIFFLLYVLYNKVF